MQQLLQSEAFWSAVGGIVSTIAVEIYTTRAAAKLAPTSRWRRAIRWLHGLLNEIDPEGNAK